MDSLSQRVFAIEQQTKIGNNVVWCKDRCISGTKYKNIFISLILSTVPFLLMFGVLAYANEYRSVIPPLVVSSVLYFSGVFALFRAGFTDPGILERQNSNYFYIPKRPIIRQVINGNLININYCYSCSIFRPPRTSHCAECDNCVLRFDHHCLWLGNCVGMRNYKFFFLLLASLNSLALFQLVYCIYFIIFQATSKAKIKKYSTVFFSALSIVIFFDIMFIMFFLGKLLLLHIFLIFQNMTFYEYIKKKWKRPPGTNPYNKKFGYFLNRLFSCCTYKTYLTFKDENRSVSETVAILNTTRSNTKVIHFVTS